MVRQNPAAEAEHIFGNLRHDGSRALIRIRSIFAISMTQGKESRLPRRGWSVKNESRDETGLRRDSSASKLVCFNGTMFTVITRHALLNLQSFQETPQC